MSKRLMATNLIKDGGSKRLMPTNLIKDGGSSRLMPTNLIKDGRLMPTNFFRVYIYIYI